MKKPVFGRKPSSPQQTPQSPTTAGGGDSDAHSGHRAMLEYLRRTEGEQPLAREQLVGKILFDMVCKMIAGDRGVRAETLLAILASTGGFSCLIAALSEMAERDPPSTDGIVIATGKNGHRYFYGDLPNFYLLESEFALLNMVLAAAQAIGGNVSLGMVQETMRYVASTVGGEDFGQPQLPAEHHSGDLPFNYVRYVWPKVLEALTVYEVPPTRSPTAIGFALQHAIDAVKGAIDPTLAARIVIECAVPMAKIDPERVAHGAARHS